MGNFTLEEVVWKGLLGAFSVIIAGLSFVVVYLISGVQDVDTRLTTIEASRCSATQCASLDSAVSHLEIAVAGLPKEAAAARIEAERLSRELWETKRAVADIEKRLHDGDIKLKR